MWTWWHLFVPRQGSIAEHGDAADPGKIFVIAGDQWHPVGAHGCGDPDVVGADQLTRGFELPVNFTELPTYIRVVLEQIEWSDECFQSRIMVYREADPSG